MLKTLFASVALALAAFATAGAIAPQAARADACSDLQTVAQHPLAANANAPDTATQAGAQAQQLYAILCPNGTAADASAPSHTPAQLADPNLASVCAPYSDPPTPPAGASRAQARAGVGAFNTWAAANNASLACHRDELAKMQREAAIYDAAGLIWQQHYIAQVNQIQTDFTTAQAAFQRAHRDQ
jgi:hypothetical protein